MKLLKEAVGIALSVLKNPISHYKPYYDDVSGKLNFKRHCSIKEIVEKLKKIKEV